MNVVRQRGLGARLEAALPYDGTGAPFLDDLLARPDAEPLRRALAAPAPARALIEAILPLAPYLRQLIETDPQRLARLLESDPEARLDALVAEGRDGAAAARSEAEAMRALRLMKQEVALLVALADLGRVWDLEHVTGALTRTADAAVDGAARFLLAQAAARGQIAAEAARDPGRSGWILLAMGKYGAAELNYSSDIDLIVLHSARRAPLGGAVEPRDFFVRLTKRLVRLLQERTADGYVFRVDLRLRPDPGSTAVSIEAEAARQYYESLGRTWERSALIKARPCAADIEAGEAFLADVAPFVWRKYLDYAAIADIQAMKRQIHAYRGHGRIAIRGHDIKLGRGGIREIEFFVQTQQLVAGGRDRRLRGRRTRDMLARLAEAGWVTAEARHALDEAYVFLRGLEHRLQMVADEQTHRVPEDDSGLLRVAHLTGFADGHAFAEALRARLADVERHYARLFEDAPPDSPLAGLLDGMEIRPGARDALAKLGFRDPDRAAALVAGWRSGRYRCLRSQAARERLAALAPALLTALAQTDNADAALTAFDRFMERLPAGVQLFSLLQANPGLLRLLADVMGSAPRLAEAVVRRAHAFDALLEPEFFATLPSAEQLGARLDQSLAEAPSYEDALDRARAFADEQKFLIGVRVITGAVTAPRAGEAYAALAQVLLAAIQTRVEAEFARTHGRVPGAAAGLLGMGKLGGREMTASSDLDLILIYDCADGTVSDGPRPLAPAHYFARLTQRLVAALTAPMAEGRVYDVDLRLRPSGRAGPLATQLSSFVAYQANEAWTWEHMALTRARPVTGSPGLASRVEAAIRNVLTGPRDAGTTLAEVRAMRGRIARDKRDGGPWDVKLAPGGLLDVEFIAQALQLVHAHAHPEILDTNTETALAKAAAAGLLAPADAELLLGACRLYQAVTQILRLAWDGPFAPAAAPGGLCRLLAQAMGEPDLERAEACLVERQAAVRAAFVRLVGPPDEAAELRVRAPAEGEEAP